METLEALGLILIGIGAGFVLTKGYELGKSIREQSEKGKEKK